MSHLLVVANETVAGRALTEAVLAHGDKQVTVVCPVNAPREGYVVYDDTRRAAAGRRLDKTLDQLRVAGISADGFVVETDPVDSVRDALAQLEPPVDAIIVSTHPESRSGWMRKHVVERIEKVAGSLPVEHVVVDLKEEGGQANVLVIANETVADEPLIAKIRERASKSPPAAFLIVSPQSESQPAGHPDAERRLRRTLAALRGAGIEAHGQISHPDPYTAAMHAVQDERVDEIIISTFPGQKSGWLRKDVVQRIKEATGVPVEHVVSEPEAGARLMTAHAADAHDHHGPPAANVSSRVDARTLGMLMFIGSEIMLFGSFFTAYFFVRVVNNPPAWPPEGFHLPVFVAGVNTAILVTSSFTMHWALTSIKRGNRAGLCAGLVLTFLMGFTFLATQVTEYARIGFAPRDNAFTTVFFSLTGLHGAHVFVGLTLLLFATIRAFRGHYTPEHHHGVELPGIYWHFVDVMWIVVYFTVYII